MKSYIEFFLYGGPFNGISVGDVKLPKDLKSGVKDILKVGKGLAKTVLALSPLGFTSCKSPDECILEERLYETPPGGIERMYTGSNDDYNHIYYARHKKWPLEIKNDTSSYFYPEWGMKKPRTQIIYKPGEYYEPSSNTNKKGNVFATRMAGGEGGADLVFNGSYGPDSTVRIITPYNVKAFGLDPLIQSGPGTGKLHRSDYTKRMTVEEFNDIIKDYVGN